MEVVASLSQGRTAAAQCGLFTHKSVPVIFEPPCTTIVITYHLFSIYRYLSFYPSFALIISPQSTTAVTNIFITRTSFLYLFSFPILTFPFISNQPSNNGAEFSALRIQKFAFDLNLNLVQPKIMFSFLK